MERETWAPWGANRLAGGVGLSSAADDGKDREDRRHEAAIGIYTDNDIVLLYTCSCFFCIFHQLPWKLTYKFHDDVSKKR